MISRLGLSLRGGLPTHSLSRSIPGHPRRPFTSFTTTRSSLAIPTLWATFPYVWLRDSCPCPACIHPSTQQKLHRSSDISLDVQPVDIKPSAQGLEITWTPINGTEALHKSFYTSSFLERHASSTSLKAFHRHVEQQPWDLARLSEFQTRPPPNLFHPYASLSDHSSLQSAIEGLLRWGILFITGVPNAETSDEKCEIRKVARMFGELRNTFYGETWDVRNVRNSKNIAYTSLFLGYHMDLLYFQNPPRYQVLHCLRNRAKGGESIFVDGLEAAKRLHSASPEHFNVLTSAPVNFHYINAGHHLHCSHPTIQLNTFPSGVSSSDKPPSIKCLNYSPPFQAPLDPETPPSFYEAFKHLTSILESTAMEFSYLMKEGDLVIFDNRRVLHGRRAFTDDPRDDDGVAVGESNRWLKGCYLSEDALFDKRNVG